MVDHENPKSEIGIEPSRDTLSITGYVAAAAFCTVSVCDNVRYGLSLGKSPIDKATYAVASVAADIFKIAVPLLAIGLWEKRHRSLAMIALVLWVGCVTWSMSSAVGFALSARGGCRPQGGGGNAPRLGSEGRAHRSQTRHTRQTPAGWRDQSTIKNRRRCAYACAVNGRRRRGRPRMTAVFYRHDFW